MIKFNGEKVLTKNIWLARKQFAENCDRCINEVKFGLVKVNDPDAYFKWMEDMKEDHLSGKSMSVTLIQRAYYIQTGKSIALLP